MIIQLLLVRKLLKNEDVKRPVKKLYQKSIYILPQRLPYKFHKKSRQLLQELARHSRQSDLFESNNYWSHKET